MAQEDMQVGGVELERARIVSGSTRWASPLEWPGTEWEDCGRT